MIVRKIACAIFALAFVAGFCAKAGAAEIQWFGQAALKITTPGGKVIIVDPFILKNPKTPKELKNLKKLGKVDLVMITHGHSGHVGDTIAIAKMNNAKIVINADMGRTFATIGWIGMKQLVRINKSGPGPASPSPWCGPNIRRKSAIRTTATNRPWDPASSSRAIFSSWKTATPSILPATRACSAI